MVGYRVASDGMPCHALGDIRWCAACLCAVWRYGVRWSGADELGRDTAGWFRMR